MSVLIRGMEMPKKCCECLLAKLSPTGESLLCNYMLSTVPWDETPSDCPLVPVPPHGRLIDADSLVNELVHSEFFSMSDYNNFVGLTLKAPTIIPAEEGET